MMELDIVPPHLLIVGGSYVGLEFGQMFRRFGSEVTIIEMAPRLVQREDEDVSSAIQDILDRRRHQPSTECSLHSPQRRRGRVTARLDCAGRQPVDRGHPSAAGGRPPAEYGRSGARGRGRVTR